MVWRGGETEVLREDGCIEDWKLGYIGYVMRVIIYACVYTHDCIGMYIWYIWSICGIKCIIGEEYGVL